MDLALPPMPFSVVAAPPGAAYLVVPEEMRTSNLSTTIELPPGVVQVIVTWQGAEPLAVRHHRGDQMEVVHVIPSAATGVQRSSGVLTLASDDLHSIRITHYSGRGDLWQQETLDRGYVAGIQVIPLGTPADITGGGSLLRVDNSVGTRVFLGDTMILGDTGLRKISSLLKPGWRASQSLSIQRVGNVIHLTGYVHSDGTATDEVIMEIPSGFQPVGTKALTAPTTAGYPANVQLLELSAAGLKAYGRALNISGTIYIEVSWVTNYSWPSSLPGTS